MIHFLNTYISEISFKLWVISFLETGFLGVGMVGEVCWAMVDIASNLWELSSKIVRQHLGLERPF